MTTTTVNAPVHYNTDKWIEENQKFFLPPVCNKMMHNEGQMKLFYVGGPNQRKDYHIEEGEELFYMIKGDMCLKVVEHNKHRDIHIKEGQIFLLPSRVAHSPQRQSDTIGMVIERERDQKEMDGLRYYIEKDGASTLESLYEEWFHCEDLGVQLAPIIKKYFASEEFKTGRPTGTIPDPPFNLDATVELEEPFSLKDWIDRNREELDGKGMVNMFGKDRQFEEGNSTANVDGKEFHLTCNDSLLVPIGKSYTSKRGTGSVALICFQDPTRKDVRQ